MKKVAILTLPLHINFGGNLQAFALYSVLKDLGYDVDLLNIQNEKTKLFGFFLNVCKQFIKSYILFKPVSYLFLEKEKELIYKNHSNFISKYLKKSNIIYDKHSFKSVIAEEKYDAVIVGSDQVWRKDYVKNIETYFLNDVENLETKKIAYAASFGVDEWQYDDEQTKKITELAKSFNYISVREDSAVELCKKYLNQHVEHVLDPTMLLSKNDYLNLCNNINTNNKGKLFNYILDNCPKKSEFINKIAKRLDKEIFSISLNKIKNEPFIKDIESFVIPPIEEWLKAFDDADFIITDSFHGMVFSIIFNKPFYVILNKERGAVRFNSLLKLLDLESRIVKKISTDELKIGDENIDYDCVNCKLEKLKFQSLSMLKGSLVE